MFSLYCTKIRCGAEKEVELKKMSDFDPNRRVAMLFHRTEPLKTRVRIFVTEDGSFGENPVPYHERAAEFQLASDTASYAYIPCGNVFDKATCTIFSIALNHDIPPQFLAYI